MTVTDEPTPPAPADLYAAVAAFSGQLADLRRLVLAGGRAGVEPAAIPSTGLLPDVTDGALIESAWGVAIGGSTGRVLQRMDNFAQVKSQWPAPVDGVRALTLDDGRVYTRRLGRWYTTALGVGLTMGPTDANGFFNITTATAGVTLDVITGGWASSGYAAGADTWAFSECRFNPGGTGQIGVVVYKLSTATSGTVLRAAAASPTTWSFRIDGYRN